MYCIVGTAGHVDHGKTSLVRALTGVETDRLAEEKKRGLTIEPGFAHIEISASEYGLGEDLALSFIDVPGHERFIRNMLSGISGIDLALFVVAADDSIMPQTIEHLDIIRLLGVKRAIFAVTKADIVTPERISVVEGEISALAEGTTLADSKILSVSARTGEGIEELKRELALLCALPGEVHAQKGNGYFRLPVDRSFAVKGFGAVATGTVASGSVSAGDKIKLFPSAASVRVRSIESRGKSVDSVRVGMRGALNLKDLSHNDISRSTVLGDPALVDFVSSSTSKCRFEVAFEFSGSAVSKIKARHELKLFHQTAETLALVRFKGRPEALPGESLFGRISLRDPLLMLRGDRFILRDNSTNATVGGGEVLAAYYGKGRLNRLGGIDFEGLKTSDPDSLLSVYLRGRWLGFDACGLDFLLNASTGDIVEKAEGFTRLGSFVVSIERLAALKLSILELLASYHREHPDLAGAREGELRRTLPRDVLITTAMLSAVIAELSSCGEVVMSGGSIRLPSHRAALAGVDGEISKAILALFPPGIAAVGKAEIKGLPFGDKETRRVLAYLLKQGTLIRLKEERFMTRECATASREMLCECMERCGGSIKATDFRDGAGVGRKLAIEILEYFDRELITLRRGDERVLREK